MHWATITVIIWVIEAAGFLTMLVGSSLLVKAITRLESKLKKPLRNILFSFLMYLVLGVYVTILVTRQFPFESYWWVITFVLGLFLAIFLVKGGHELLKEIERS